MLATENEATSKGCVLGERGLFQNEETGEENICGGSRCMGWRWFDPLNGDQDACIRLIPGGAGAKRHVDLDQRRGYCGLAGVSPQ